MVYTFSQAAHLLHVSPNTLRSWVAQAGLEAERGSIDGRTRCLTLEQVQKLARLHNREVITLSNSHTLEVRTESLERRLEELEEIVSGLQKYGERYSTSPIKQVEQVLRVASAEESFDGAQALQHVSNMQAHTIIRRAIELIRVAGAPPSSANQIWITFQSETNLFDSAPLLRREWRRTLREALDKGWDIIHLIRRTPNLQRTLTIVEDMVHLLGARGNYTPLYFSAPDITPFTEVPRDLIIVPGQGVLEIPAARPGKPIDGTVLHLPRGNRTDMLLAEVTALSVQAEPLIKGYSPRSPELFSAAIARVEAQEGDRCLVINGLSDLTMPITLHEERFRLHLQTKRRATAQRAQAILQHRRRREEDFERLLSSGRGHFRDVCPASSIEKYVKTGVYSPHDSFKDLGCPPLTPDQRKRHLTHLIERLEAYYPNYEFGLIDDDDDDHRPPDKSIYRTFWLAKADYSVLLETYSPRGEIDLEITDTDVVKAFFQYFNEHLWRSLPLPNRTKEDVIHWLRHQIDQIPPESSQNSA